MARRAGRLMLGNPGMTFIKQSQNLRQIVAAYGQCIAVLIASTRTYIQQRLDEPATSGGPDIAQLEKCLIRIKELEKDFQSVREKEEKGEVSEDRDGVEVTAFERYIEIDAQLIAIIPGDFLVARRWILLDRMRRVSPQKALIEYEGSLPPSMDKGKRDNADMIRADLLSLSTYMQQLYILNARREQTLASIKWWLLSRVIAVVLAIAVIFWLATVATPARLPFAPWELPWMPTALVLIFLTGMVGAVVSISRKFQDIGGQNILVADPFNELVSLNFSRESIAGSIASGGVFALVLYLMVISGSTDALGLDMRFFPSLTEKRTIVDVGEREDAGNGTTSAPAAPAATAAPAPVAPAAPATPTAPAPPTSGSAAKGKATDPGPNAGQPVAPPRQPAAPPAKTKLLNAQYIVRANDHVPMGIEKLSKALGFFYNADILRMMLLAFLAGFAERLVPDSIDRLVRKEKAVKEAAV
ncbi:hypothetical protein Q4610_07220 [Sphingobium sp. HBC34]|uniref:Uncharacterized protein n=1 Tax=Sphingobium cyanobacteriorum TaxID=3063954 RepID=A0ABT8ZM61_9SPHN|nr:hypothetical protein [Sphingobium sp. HBC34]MDO7834835.1 hypothetical protein [Sphingobium sp. HBC34]